MWKIARPSEAGSTKIRLVKTSGAEPASQESVTYQNSTPEEANRSTQLEPTDSSSSSSIHSEIFDRTPLNTESEETGLSSVSSAERSDPFQSHSIIKETPKSFSAVRNPEGARKRIALSPPRSSAAQAEPSAQDDPMSSRPLSQLHIEPDVARLQSPQKLSPKTSQGWNTIPRRDRWKPSSSIPAALSWEEYGRQCILAANMSRLSPYALHQGEYRLLKGHLPPQLATTYLNIRNGVLRLWTRNPLVSVTLDEAAGCVKESRYFNLAVFAYQWLVRNGYINFGCIDVPRPQINPPRGRKPVQQKTIVVIGAGMSGLGCARQLEGLIGQYQDRWVNRGEHPPKVIVLEGRTRIGGRVYSHPLRSQVKGSLPDDLRNTAEMGAQIITGFQHGNPLDAIVRGQLGLQYHLMWDEIVMHDSNGKAVDRDRDILVNKIHNDVLERTSDFRIRSTVTETMEGLQDFIDVCQEPAQVDFEARAVVAKGTEEQSNATAGAGGQDRSQVVPPGFAKLQGRTQVVAGNSSSRTAAQAARSAGWELRPGISRNHSLNLDNVVKSSNTPTLGSTMDEALRQYQHLVQLTPQDMRMLNWHYADLEYANAAMVSQLSLGGHDQDSGNEFEGRHSEVVGGYIQVPRGLMMLPHQLEVQFDSAVKTIKYSADGQTPAQIECVNGETIEADKVILTAPLGVLKAQAISFEPALPEWKQGAIERLGFGVLNKIVLVFEKPFWDEQYDMFGMLNNAERENSMNPDDYAKGRGKFYLVWNCISNSGRPMLIALMSGHAAHAAEVTPTATLLKEILGRLTRTFAPKIVPAPVEVIVTRWKKDPFTRGTYSFVAPGTQPGDYDVMAAPVGNLHFAGEATCGTHPATVHGAYLSGLRAAADIMEELVGSVEVPSPLLPEREDFGSPAVSESSQKVSIAGSATRKPSVGGRPRKSSIKIKTEIMADAVPATPSVPTVNPYRSINSARWTEHVDQEAALQFFIISQIGERPPRPTRPGVNPFLVYTAEKWNECKAEESAVKAKTTGDANAKATRNEVRIAIGRNWRLLPEESRRPYNEQCEAAQQLANEARAEWARRTDAWDREAKKLRAEWGQQHVAGLGEDGKSAE
ncbi:flavin-containing amine oxidoreductase-domain containing protein [Elsinoe ampelina]|uniref:Flavin-containing amine oxidoreductase-domain containing protein n=1 Tax=Elsinoe ampelina TaxID=302913 RepID=A0A6A6G8A0_9PEZI|nr:flavin-containing amine oxidoreductase-domain containing protein [Elsinoe ampelina]